MDGGENYEPSILSKCIRNLRIRDLIGKRRTWKGWMNSDKKCHTMCRAQEFKSDWACSSGHTQLIHLLATTDLQSLHGLWVLVSLDLAGHEQLSCGGSHLFGWRNELLLTGMALYCRICSLAQVIGCCSNHAGLGQRNSMVTSSLYKLSYLN